jgi:fibronectin-binding autotransporter adhesin
MKIRVLILAAALVADAPADVIYSNLRDIPIPADFNGVYLDLDTGTTFLGTTTGAPTGWDINPFFGGAGIANSPAFQPVRTGTGNLDAIVKLEAGATVSSLLTYSSGYGGSGDDNQHIGAAPTQFQSGGEGYLGLQFTKNGSPEILHGWMRVTLTNNDSGALIRDWGYEDSGAAITVGRVYQSAPSGGNQLVTLSPGVGESFTLGSAITDTVGNLNSVLKTGAGRTILSSTNTYSGGTSIVGGSLLLGSGSALPSNGGMTLSAGKLETGGFSVSTGPLSQSSGIIDFGTGATGSLTFSDTGTWSGVLSVWNWTGQPNTAGNAGTDRLIFSSNTGLGAGARDLSSVQFFSDNGQNQVGGGSAVFMGNELVPVPEPGAMAAAGALLALAVLRREIPRRRPV